jgi:hypothetical protein
LLQALDLSVGITWSASGLVPTRRTYLHEPDGRDHQAGALGNEAEDLEELPVVALKHLIEALISLFETSVPDRQGDRPLRFLDAPSALW